MASPLNFEEIIGGGGGGGGGVSWDCTSPSTAVAIIINSRGREIYLIRTLN